MEQCYLEDTPDYVNGEINTEKVIIYGKFLIFGNVIMTNETVNVMGEESERAVCTPVEALMIGRVNDLIALISAFIKEGEKYMYIALVSKDEINRMMEIAKSYKDLGLPLTKILEKIQIKRPVT